MKFKEQILEVIRVSGLDKIAPHPRWVRFEMVDRIFKQDVCYFNFPDDDGENYNDDEFTPHPDIPENIFQLYLRQTEDSINRIVLSQNQSGDHLYEVLANSLHNIEIDSKCLKAITIEL